MSRRRRPPVMASLCRACLDPAPSASSARPQPSSQPLRRRCRSPRRWLPSLGAAKPSPKCVRLSSNHRPRHRWRSDFAPDQICSVAVAALIPRCLFITHCILTGAGQSYQVDRSAVVLASRAQPSAARTVHRCRSSPHQTDGRFRFLQQRSRR